MPSSESNWRRLISAESQFASFSCLAEAEMCLLRARDQALLAIAEQVGEFVPLDGSPESLNLLDRHYLATAQSRSQEELRYLEYCIGVYVGSVIEQNLKGAHWEVRPAFTTGDKYALWIVVGNFSLSMHGMPELRMRAATGRHGALMELLETAKHFEPRS